MNPRLVEVIGWENGGIELNCLECDEFMAAGGCDCCTDNTVTLLDLMTATREHLCKEKP